MLAGALLLQGLSGVAGGFALVADPSGGALGLPRSWLDGSPFEDYLMPGLILLFILGLIPLIVAWVVWKARRGSWLAALAVGVALLGWLAVQVLVIGYQADPPLQAIYGALGLGIVVLSLLPSVRRLTA